MRASPCEPRQLRETGNCRGACDDQGTLCYRHSRAGGEGLEGLTYSSFVEIYKENFIIHAY